MSHYNFNPPIDPQLVIPDEVVTPTGVNTENILDEYIASAERRAEALSQQLKGIFPGFDPATVRNAAILNREYFSNPIYRKYRDIERELEAVREDIRELRWKKAAAASVIAQTPEEVLQKREENVRKGKELYDRLHGKKVDK